MFFNQFAIYLHKNSKEKSRGFQDKCIGTLLMFLVTNFNHRGQQQFTFDTFCLNLIKSKNNEN